MKRVWVFILFLGLLLFGCTSAVGQGSSDEKGGFDLKGAIQEVNGNSFLLDDEKHGLVRVSLLEEESVGKFKVGQLVAVWVKGGIRESYPAQADALHVEVLEE